MGEGNVLFVKNFGEDHYNKRCYSKDNYDQGCDTSTIADTKSCEPAGSNQKHRYFHTRKHEEVAVEHVCRELGLQEEEILRGVSSDALYRIISVNRDEVEELNEPGFEQSTCKYSALN